MGFVGICGILVVDPYGLFHDLRSLEVFAAIERLQDPPLVCENLDHGSLKSQGIKTTQDQLVKGFA